MPLQPHLAVDNGGRVAHLELLQGAAKARPRLRDDGGVRSARKSPPKKSDAEENGRETEEGDR